MELELIDKSAYDDEMDKTSSVVMQAYNGD